MAHANLVVDSINDENASRCVDIFRRADGTFGFEEFRRDIEDARGWFPVGGYSDQSFEGRDEALSAAYGTIGWLPQVRPRDP